MSNGTEREINRVEELLIENGYDLDIPVILFAKPDFHEAFIGMSHEERAVYSYDKMLEVLMEKGDSEDDARMVLDNTIRNCEATPKSPIIVFSYE